MYQKSKHYKKWLIQAPIGLMIVGLGIVLITEAAMMKYSGREWWVWFSAGTVALVVFNSGLSIFGGAILHRVRYENERKTNL